jgi:SAM-dependent methyltransferase
MQRLLRRSAAALSVLLLAATAGQAQPRSREDCEAAHAAAWGRAGKDVVWVPTFDAVVLAMLGMAQVTPQDLVLDLGAGDGKIAIAAAKAPFGARAVGIEHDPDLAKRAACLVQVEGLADKVRIVQGDIFKEDFGSASVVTMYLLPHLNLCVRHRLLAMAPGTRVVSHQYAMAEWEPDQSVQIQGRDVRAWVVPARVDGVWDFQDSQGTTFAIDLRQSFATLAGEITRGDVREALRSATLRGPELRFAFDAAGAALKFSGTVRGDEITGVLSTGTVARTAVGRLRGGLRARGGPRCRRTAATTTGGAPNRDTIAAEAGSPGRRRRDHLSSRVSGGGSSRPPRRHHLRRSREAPDARLRRHGR